MKNILFLFCLTIVVFATNAIADEDVELTPAQKQEIDTTESKKSMENWLSGIFGLQPYRTNYLLPYGYSSKVYDTYTPTDKYQRNEAELQVSLKMNVARDIFGLNELYYLSYTHTAFWQLYADSSPFRETNYNPEGFVVFPVYDRYSDVHLRSVKVAIAHKSNGQGNNKDVVYPPSPTYNTGNRSRSINYLYSTVRFEHGTLLTDITAMWPFPESKDGNDNPDIMDYLGYTKIELTYFYKKNMFTLMARGNIASGKGAIQGTYSYPLINDTYLYFKAFSGYGESLIDYNNNLNKFSVGFSFSR